MDKQERHRQQRDVAVDRVEHEARHALAVQPAHIGHPQRHGQRQQDQRDRASAPGQVPVGRRSGGGDDAHRFSSRAPRDDRRGRRRDRSGRGWLGRLLERAAGRTRARPRRARRPRGLGAARHRGRATVERLLGHDRDHPCEGDRTGDHPPIELGDKAQSRVARVGRSRIHTPTMIGPRCKKRLNGG